MINNPVSQFENSLRRATRRKGCEDEIKEVASHYQDLYQEALNKGATIEEARKHADDHIGNVNEIAKGIRAGNGKSSGMKLQWTAAGLFVFGAMLYRIVTMHGVEIGTLRGNIMEAMDPAGLMIVYAAGFLAVLGILRAKRVSIVAFGLAIALVSFGHAWILLRPYGMSFSAFDARMKAHDDTWHQYAVKYRPIMSERYNLYVASITGTPLESDDAIRKLSASVKRPQDRGAVLLNGEKGKWIYPLKDEEVRKHNIRVFPLRDDNLNWIHFGATESFAVAQQKWHSSDELLKAIPILRKGSEAEFANTSKMHRSSAMATILAYVAMSVLALLYSLALSFLLFGIATKLKQLITGIRRAL